MMDNFAEKGWIVLGVDYFGGVSVLSFLFLLSFFFMPIKNQISKERRKSNPRYIADDENC
jgi:hypothetical protein